jgi:hypothetical protein
MRIPWLQQQQQIRPEHSHSSTYSPLADPEDTKPPNEDGLFPTYQDHHPTHERKSRPRLLLPLLYGFVALTSLWGLIDLLVRLEHAAATTTSTFPWRKPAAGREWVGHECFCANTAVEARAQGCEFDELASIYLHPRCIDRELSREFSRSGPGADGSWPYYFDREGTRPVTVEEVAGLEDLSTTTYSVFEWHLAHCYFYWRKLFRQPLTGVVMEPHFDIEHHVTHCSQYFLMRFNLSEVRTGGMHIPPRGYADLDVSPKDFLEGRWLKIDP